MLLGIGLVLSAGPLHAQTVEEDEGDDGKSFERKLMDNFMSGLGGRRIDDGTIDYRERSPLVVPSKIALPPPQTGKTKLAPNWPKDPDLAEREAARQASNQKAMSPEEARRTLLPSELNVKKPRAKGTTADAATPGGSGRRTDHDAAIGTRIHWRTVLECVRRQLQG